MYYFVVALPTLCRGRYAQSTANLGSEFTPGARLTYLLFCRRSSRWLGNACSACLAEISGPGTRMVL